MDNNPHKGHRERTRQRFEAEGLQGFEPHQVLELLLFYAFSRKDTNELAHALLDKFGTIDRVFDADISSLMEVKGIGYNSAVLLKLIPETAQYYARERFRERKCIENCDKMGEYFCSRIGFMRSEVFAAAAFDARRSELAFEVLSEGFVSQTSVQPRRLAEFAILNKAEQLVIAHNHVSGDTTPSQADRDTTRIICTRMNDIGIKVIDHIIVSGENYYSFAANGIMPMI